MIIMKNKYLAKCYKKVTIKDDDCRRANEDNKKMRDVFLVTCLNHRDMNKNAYIKGTT